MTKTKTFHDIKENDIIVWEGNIFKVLNKNMGMKYYSILGCLVLGKNGRFGREIENVSVFYDDCIPVAKTIKEAKEILSEVFAPEENLPFFVYGTLREGCGNYRAYLKGNTINEMPATVEGLLYHQNSIIPYLVKGNGTVHGELMFVDNGLFPVVLSGLDALEGYRKNARWNHYTRERVIATTNDGMEIEAYAYYYGDEVSEGMFPIVSGDYKEWVHSFDGIRLMRQRRASR